VTQQSEYHHISRIDQESKNQHGWYVRMRFRGQAGWIAGALSGLLGGLVGNQGGLRSAALLGFDLSKTKFVGTATAVALFLVLLGILFTNLVLRLLARAAGGTIAPEGILALLGFNALF